MSYHDYEGPLIEKERRNAMPWLYEDYTPPERKRTPYVRKTVDEFDLEQQTSEGWEVVCCEPTRKEAQARKKEYQENQPGYNYRIVKHRVKRDQL
jgi:hypothetical protein